MKPILNHNEVTWPKPGQVVVIQSSHEGVLRALGYIPGKPGAINFRFVDGTVVSRPFTVDGMATVFVRTA